MALYVYGVMRTPDARAAVDDMSADGQGDAAEPDRPQVALETVACEDVSALVSPVSADHLKLRRESALAHTDTLQAAFAHGPVLPVRFGTVLPDAEAVRGEFLAPRAGDLLARLEALRGMAEMQVKATYLEEPLLRSVLAASSSLAQAAARIQALPPAATHFDRINLGEAIAEAVQVRRRQDAERLLGELRPLAVTASLRDPRHEREILNASFLVADEHLEEFDTEVERLSNETAEEMQFRLIGPMPAHSFAHGTWEATAATGESSWD